MTGAAPASYRTARFASQARQINVRATDERRKITGNVTITTHALLAQNAVHIELEGTVAHWAAHLLALDHRVVDVQSEPMTIYYDDGGGEKRYHPDLLVTYRAGTTGGHPNTVLYEFKFRKFLRENLEKLRPRIHAAHALCLNRGWAFRVVTETRILRFYPAYSFLVPYIYCDIEPNLKLELIDVVTANPGAHVWDLMERYPDRKLEALAAIWTLLAHGTVGADLSKPLTNRTPIYPANLGPSERVL